MELHSSTIEFSPAVTNLGAATYRIYAELSTRPSFFGDTHHNITSRPLTEAYVDWNVTSWTAGASVFSPSLEYIIGEVCEQSGWVSGEPIVLVFISMDASQPALVASSATFWFTPISDVSYELPSQVDTPTYTRLTNTTISLLWSPPATTHGELEGYIAPVSYTHLTLPTIYSV